MIGLEILLGCTVGFLRFFYDSTTAGSFGSDRDPPGLPRAGWWFHGLGLWHRDHVQRGLAVLKGPVENQGNPPMWPCGCGFGRFLASVLVLFFSSTCKSAESSPKQDLPNVWRRCSYRRRLESRLTAPHQAILASSIFFFMLFLGSAIMLLSHATIS